MLIKVNYHGKYNETLQHLSTPPYVRPIRIAILTVWSFCNQDVKSYWKSDMKEQYYCFAPNSRYI